MTKQFLKREQLGCSLFFLLPGTSRFYNIYQASVWRHCAATLCRKRKCDALSDQSTPKLLSLTRQRVPTPALETMMSPRDMITRILGCKASGGTFSLFPTRLIICMTNTASYSLIYQISCFRNQSLLLKKAKKCSFIFSRNGLSCQLSRSILTECVKSSLKISIILNPKSESRIPTLPSSLHLRD